MRLRDRLTRKDAERERSRNGGTDRQTDHGEMERQTDRQIEGWRDGDR